jgi:dUTP pyrophosphatase
MTTGPAPTDRTSSADIAPLHPAPASLSVRIRRIDPDVPLPGYAMPGDAGADLVTTVDCRLEPGQRAVVPTGVAIALPVGYAAFVHPR